MFCVGYNDTTALDWRRIIRDLHYSLRMSFHFRTEKVETSEAVENRRKIEGVQNTIDWRKIMRTVWRGGVLEMY